MNHPSEIEDFYDGEEMERQATTFGGAIVVFIIVFLLLIVGVTLYWKHAL